VKRTHARKEVVVIGGGLAGLAAATAAAREGMNVKVLERSHRVGGLASSRETHGFVFNIGPHALYPASQSLLKQLGINVSGGIPPLSGYALAGGHLWPMPEGPLGLLQGPPFGLDERREIESAFAKIVVDAATLPGDVTLASWLDEHGLHGRPRQFIESLARLASYADAPNLFSAQAAFSQMLDGAAGVIYPDGGWQSIVESLRSVAMKAGVVIGEAAPANAIEQSGTGFRITLTDGTAVHGDRVVVALGPGALRGLLSGAMTEDLLPDPLAAVRFAALDIGLSRLPNPEGGFVLSLDSPLYLSTHSLAARLTPEGGAAVSVGRYLRPGEDPQPKPILKELEGLMDLVQPGWREVEVVRQFLPSITVTSGFPPAAEGGVSGRPEPTALGVPGLFLAGDWIGNDGQLSAASLASGILAGKLAAGRVDEQSPQASAA